MSTPAVVLIAHGSRASAANDAHRAVAEQLAARLARPVVAAFLELADPSIGAGIDRAVADGATDVLVLPHFLYPGRHVRQDVPALVAEAAERHPDVTVELLGASGEDPRVVDLLAEQIFGAAGR